MDFVNLFCREWPMLDADQKTDRGGFLPRAASWGQREKSIFRAGSDASAKGVA
jgi:hypothetical protein